MILHNLEKCADNEKAAEKAKEKATEMFMEHRREGGENMTSGGKLCMMAIEAVAREQASEMLKMMDGILDDPQTPRYGA